MEIEGFLFSMGRPSIFFNIVSFVPGILRNGIGGADWFKSGCALENREWVLSYSFWLFFNLFFFHMGLTLAGTSRLS